MPLGVSATDRRRPLGVSAEEREQVARWLPFGEEPLTLAVAKPPGTHHLVARKRRVPATDSKNGLLVGGCNHAALSA
jgi:hypothetical protein